MRIDPLQIIPAAALLLIVLGGCPSKRPTGGGDGAATDGGRNHARGESPNGQALRPAPKTPEELVARMRAVYANAQSYSDNGFLHWQIVEGETWQPERVDFSTRFLRPNMFDLHVHGLRVVSDGKLLRAVIKDSTTRNYDGQFLEKSAPDTLTLDALHEDGEIALILSDDSSDEVDDDHVDATPWPLRLLTDDPAINDLLSGEIGAMADESLDGTTYRRVRVRRGPWAATLWIDPKTFVLRRVELPEPEASLGAKSFVADYKDARVDDAQIDIQPLGRPRDAKVVKFFVPPPLATELPSPLLGAEVDDFEMETGQGRVVRRDQLGDGVVVLAWFLANEASKETLQQLQQVADARSGDRAVNIYAVSPQPETLTTESIRKTLRGMDVTLPLLRDTTAVGRDTFEIPGAPTVVVLDRQRRVQAFKAGSDPLLGKQLPKLLDELLAGRNPAGELKRMVAEQASHYRQQLAAAQSDGSSTVIELAETPLAARRNPAKLKLTELWNNNEIKQPGNILIVDGGTAGPRIFVHEHADDWRTIVELNAAGEVVATRQLPVPESSAISLLRTFVNKDGQRWYAGSARMGRQVFVFNDQFELAFAYPAADTEHQGIGDFALVDFQGEGEPQLCVGFWGLLGVHGVNMQGEYIWSNRKAASVVSLAPTPPNELGWRQVLATGARGEIVPINGFGKNDLAMDVEGRSLTQLIGSGFAGENASAYMGTALQANGAPLAIALTPDLEIAWDVPLPDGAHRNQIQPIAHGRLVAGGAPQWVFAGADGTIGIISDDVALADSLATGQRLSGVAVTRFAKAGVLLLSTPDGVAAWRVDALQGPSR